MYPLTLLQARNLKSVSRGREWGGGRLHLETQSTLPLRAPRQDSSHQLYYLAPAFAYHLLSVQLRSASAPFSRGRSASQVLRPLCFSADPLLGFFYLEINIHILSFFLSPHDLIITSSYQWIIFDCPYLPLWVAISHLQRSPGCGQFGVIRVKFPPPPAPSSSLLLFFLTRFKWAELQFLSHLPKAMCDLALWHTHKCPYPQHHFSSLRSFTFNEVQLIKSFHGNVVLKILSNLKMTFHTCYLADSIQFCVLSLVLWSILVTLTEDMRLCLDFLFPSDPLYWTNLLRSLSLIIGTFFDPLLKMSWQY